jgi:uncharacterized coiled-coil protein SlyX
MPIVDRIIGLRRARRQAEERGQPAPAATDPLLALEKRIAHLETMIEGLQDAVHREACRTNRDLDQLRKRIEPSEMSRALSEDARERGL